MVIPECLTNQLVDCIHSKLGYPGVYKTTMYLRQFYYCKSMNKEIKMYVLSCDLCQRVKSPNTKMECPYNLIRSREPGDLVTVDFYGPLPRSCGVVEYIFVVLDAFSKYAKLYPIKKANTETVLRKMFNFYIPEMGKPRRVLADHGTQFMSPVWTDTLRGSDIKAIFFPQSDIRRAILPNVS